jgi:L-malate glycosyltransferase
MSTSDCSLTVGVPRVTREARPGLGTKTAQAVLRLTLRAGVRACLMLAAAGRRLVGRRPPADRGHLLLTATFYSDNWIKAHLVPLATSSRCGRITVVATTRVPDIPKVEGVYPPAWLLRAVGEVPARLLVFTWVAVTRRPDWVAGVHLLVNGLVAYVLAHIVGARSLYFCVGGPGEVVGGGIGGENRMFGKLREPDPILERKLLDVVAAFDLTITMGHGAARFFRTHGVQAPVEVVPGGFDSERFSVGCRDRDIDCVLVARLAAVKRIDTFLEAFRRVLDQRPSARAVVCGDGELRAELTAKAHALGLGTSVEFVGLQTDVIPWLQRSRVFVLTSRTEGVALSLIEAMLCGAVPVVSDVGDLGDMVRHGENGYLVADRNPDQFAAFIQDVLDRRRAFSAAARETAAVLSIDRVATAWDAILSSEHAGV